MKDSLAKLLQSYIDTYFPETASNFEVYPQVIEISERDHGNYENEGYEVRREFYRSDDDVERKYEEREEKNGNEEHEEQEEQEENAEHVEHVEQEQEVQEEQMEHKEESNEELENENL